MKILDSHIATANFTVLAMSNTTNTNHESCMISMEVYDKDLKLCYVDSPVANHKRFIHEVGRGEYVTHTATDAIKMFKQDRKSA